MISKKSVAYYLAIFCFHFFAIHLLADEEKQDKIALLFLTRQDVNFPEIWEALLEEAPDLYNVYIHSKEPLETPFFQAKRIAKIVPTTWSIHCRAWQALIQAALKDPENKKFVFVSEACMPLYSLTHIYHFLMQDARSHMAYSRPWWKPSNPRELQEIKSENRFGNSEWIILNRKHAEIVAKDRGVIRIIAKHPNDQESYFSTLLSIHNCLEEVHNHSYTYANMYYATNNGASPYHFDKDNALSQELIQDAYQIGALFLRKVSKTFPASTLYSSIFSE